MSAFTWGVIALLIGLNALFVAAEFAAVSVRRSRIRQLAGEGNRFARSLLPTLEEGQQLDRYVAACQVGITVSSLILGAFGQAHLAGAITPLFERWGGMQAVAAQSAAAAAVLIVLSTLQMVMGELTPKSLALQYPTRMALLTVLPMRWAERLLAWFIAILNGSGWLVLRLLGVEPKAHRHLHSADEIKYLVAESHEGGFLRAEEHRRLNYALGLTQRIARELMVPRTRVVAVDEADGAARALETVASSPYTRFPVYVESMDRIVGIINSKDLIALRLAGTLDETTPLTPSIRPILAVHERVSADRVLSLMREEGGVMAVVVDDFGGTSGIITAEDIISEVLGEFADEFKRAGGLPQRLADGRVRLAGDMPVYEAEPWLGTPWEGYSDTVGGMVTEHLGRIPEPGDTLEIAGVAVEVEGVEHHAVRTILARPAPPASEGEEPA